MQIKGIFVPNIVPFTPEGQVNEHELRRLVDWLIDKGVSGLYPNGSTGEFIRLGFEERLRVVEIVADETRGRVPILAGAAEPNMEMALKACRHYAELGCRAVSITGPYYYPVSQAGIEQYFREVAAQTPIDIVLYNIPQFSNEISLAVVRRLAMDCPRIIGTKDSSRDMPRLLNTLNDIKAERPDFAVLTGCEEILFPCLMMGADGGTIATAGVAPEAIMKLYHGFLNHDWAECKRIQFKILELINTMLVGVNFPEGFRTGCALRGFETGPPRQPLAPGEREDVERIREKLACLLSECGLHDDARACPRANFQPQKIFGATASAHVDTEAIVQAVMRNLRQ